jgi:hypothetical protein
MTTNDRRNPFAETTADLVENLIPAGKKPRSRAYEKRNPGYQYYLRDAEIGKRISDIAYHYNTTVDDIAASFVQIALERADQIPWDQFPAHGNATLRAGRNGRWEVQADGWPPEKVRERPRGKRSVMTPEERKRKKATYNARQVCYRWSASIHSALVRLEEERFGKPTGRKDGRLGLVLTALLQFTLALFEQGKLRHIPAPRAIKITSEWEVDE